LSSSDVLLVDDLSVGFNTEDGFVEVIEDVSFSIKPGEVLGLVGESGSGKTVAAMSLLSLLPSPPAKRLKGQILLGDVDLTALTSKQLLNYRGRDVGYIFQEPMNSLNPTYKIGYQLMEPLKLHTNLSKSEIRAKAIEMLNLVGINEPERRLEQYPFELSGGIRQRVMIAMALICEPKLLIADEPTTALDVTIQAQIMDLLRNIRKELKTAILLITHDMGLVAENCDRVAVMYAGRIVETGSVTQVMKSPRHPYTKALLESIPDIHNKKEVLPTIAGMVPAPGKRPVGCNFQDRCTSVIEKCRQSDPGLEGKDHLVECWNPVS
jgi:oligopeptide/dipeptide ABC transporter ATP-binding protein